jgi:hypothetical protein
VALTPADLRKHLSTALEDPALQRYIDAAYEAIVQRAGLSAAPRVADQFVVSTNMKVGAYALAHTDMPTVGARRITVAHTAAGAADTLGTIDIVGLSVIGTPLSESIVPLAGAVASGAVLFASISSVTGTGWVINGGNDTITVGCEALGVTDMLGGTNGPLLMLNREALAITTVTENGVLLDPLDYQLRSSGKVVERLRTGPHPRSYWAGRVDIAYTPLTDVAARDRIAIALVKLDLTHNPGIVSESIGDYAATYAPRSGGAANYDLEREAILESLLLEHVGIY